MGLSSASQEYRYSRNQKVGKNSPYLLPSPGPAPCHGLIHNPSSQGPFLRPLSQPLTWDFIFSGLVPPLSLLLSCCPLQSAALCPQPGSLQFLQTWGRALGWGVGWEHVGGRRTSRQRGSPALAHRAGKADLSKIVVFYPVLLTNFLICKKRINAHSKIS